MIRQRSDSSPPWRPLLKRSTSVPPLAMITFCDGRLSGSVVSSTWASPSGAPPAAAGPARASRSPAALPRHDGVADMAQHIGRQGGRALLPAKADTSRRIRRPTSSADSPAGAGPVEPSGRVIGPAFASRSSSEATNAAGSTAIFASSSRAAASSRTIVGRPAALQRIGIAVETVERGERRASMLAVAWMP